MMELKQAIEIFDNVLADNKNANVRQAIELLKIRPVVLTYLDGDSYGGDSTAFEGTGMPIVITFDGSRYDKYNSDEDDNPRDDYAEDLESIAFNQAAYDMLKEWIENAAESLDNYFDR